MKKRYTVDRKHWTQSICDLRIAANVNGLTDQEAVIAEAIYDVIPQYRVAAKVLAQGKVYTRIAPQVGGHKDLDANCGAAYTWEDGQLVTICHNTPVYRMQRMIEAYPDYLSGRIDADIWNNYSHGGYMTRRGLYANYGESHVSRIGRIALSHVECTIEGKAGHDIRVAMRA
jgi:hypothetical protein